MAQEGETVLLTTACCADGVSGDGSFLPLQVNYFERFSAAGRTSGGFNKRNNRQGMGEVLTSRLVDRPLRPMFAKGWANETQVLTWVLSYDGLHCTEPLAITAAGAALVISDIPFSKAVAGVRVGYIAGGGGAREFVINPTTQQMEGSTLDLVVAGTAEAVLMIEGFCEFLTDGQMLEAIRVGHEAIQGMCTSIDAWAERVGKAKRTDLVVPPQGLDELVQELVGERIEGVYRSIPSKQERGAAIGELKDEAKQRLAACDGGEAAFAELDVSQAFKRVESSIMRRLVLAEGFRADGRAVSQVRPISCRASVLPRTHGSALFTRGETQAMAVTTLGGADAAQRVDSMLNDNEVQHFFLQYYFPQSSVGEVGRIGPPGRRELGHGNLAERALLPVVPDAQQFPYSMRVESTITESNGSSSMATVCGGCLSMMDAGVPIKAMVAGVAMGLILEPDGSFTVLTDILGSEDALGDMDFKVAGSSNAITAFQMDIKVEGITLAIMEQALREAKAGRTRILQEMSKCNPPPSGRMSPYAPRIVRFSIDPSKVGLVIGSGGRTIKGLTETAGVDTITINDTGTVEVIGYGDEATAKARELVTELVTEAAVGQIYRGVTVEKLATFGVFVRTAAGRTGLVHISELDVERTPSVADCWKEGDTMDVMIIEVQDRDKLRMSRKEVMIRDAAEQGIVLKVSRPPSSDSDGEEGGGRPGTPGRDGEQRRRPGGRRPGGEGNSRDRPQRQSVPQRTEGSA